MKIFLLIHVSIILLIPLYISSFSLNTHFELFCDDFCTKVSSGSNLLYSEGTGGESCEPKYFDKVINIEDQISIDCTNNKREFGFSGSIDYHYFTATTNRQQFWTVEGDKCQERKVEGGYNMLKDYYLLMGIKNLDGRMNKNTCTFKYQLSLCLNNKIYINDNKDILFEDFLKVERGTNFNDLTMIVNANSNNHGMIKLVKDGNIESSNEVSGGHVVNYQVVDRYIIDSFSFSVYAKDKQFSNDEIEFDTNCQGNIIVCGEHCSKCDELTFACSGCDKNYAMKEDNQRDCFDTIVTIPNYFYDSNNDIFKKCPSQCSSCSKPTSRTTEYICDECSTNFPYYYKQGNKYKCIITCVPDYILGFSHECIHVCNPDRKSVV